MNQWNRTEYRNKPTYIYVRLLHDKGAKNICRKKSVQYMMLGKLDSKVQRNDTILQYTQKLIKME